MVGERGNAVNRYKFHQFSSFFFKTRFLFSGQQRRVVEDEGDTERSVGTGFD